MRTDENQWARLQQRNTKENEIGRRKRSDGFVKLGLQINDFDWTVGPEQITRADEEAGFDRIDVADHPWQHPILGSPEAKEPERYAMLASLAANTERLKLWAMVGSVLRRVLQCGHPG